MKGRALHVMGPESLFEILRKAKGLHFNQMEAIIDGYVSRQPGLDAIKRAEESLKKVIEQNEPGVYEAFLAYFKSVIFYALRHGTYARLRADPNFASTLKAACEYAIGLDDKDFFIELGSALSAIPRPPESTKLTKALFNWWETPKIPGTPSLSEMTDKALHEFLCLALENKNLSFDALRKTRQRLKLKRWKAPTVTAVYRTKNGIEYSEKPNVLRLIYGPTKVTITLRFPSDKIMSDFLRSIEPFLS